MTILSTENKDNVKGQLLEAIQKFEPTFEFAAENLKEDGTVVLVGPPGSFVACFGGERMKEVLGLFISVNADAAIMASVLLNIYRAFTSVQILGPIIEIQNPEGISFTSDIQEVYTMKQDYTLREAQRIIMSRAPAEKSKIIVGGGQSGINAAQAIRKAMTNPNLKPNLIVPK